jgi:hypothetical protein
MTAATRSALLLAATLALGLVLGALGMGALQRERRAQLGGLGRPPGFARHVEETIRPRDAAQEARVRPVIARAVDRNQRIIREANAQLRASVDSLRTEMDSLLDDSQRQRLAEMTRGLPPFGPGRGGRPGPGGRPGRRGPPPFERPVDGGPPPPGEPGPR